MEIKMMKPTLIHADFPFRFAEVGLMRYGDTQADMRLARLKAFLDKARVCRDKALATKIWNIMPDYSFVQTFCRSLTDPISPQ